MCCFTVKQRQRVHIWNPTFLLLPLIWCRGGWEWLYTVRKSVWLSSLDLVIAWGKSLENSFLLRTVLIWSVILKVWSWIAFQEFCKVKIIFKIMLRSYFPFSLCWHLGWWFRSKAGSSWYILIESGQWYHTTTTYWILHCYTLIQFFKKSQFYLIMFLIKQ